MQIAGSCRKAARVNLHTLFVHLQAMPVHLQTMSVNLHTSRFNLHEPPFNLQTRAFNLHEPSVNLHTATFSLQTAGFGWKSHNSVVAALLRSAVYWGDLPALHRSAATPVSICTTTVTPVPLTTPLDGPSLLCAKRNSNRRMLNGMQPYYNNS